MEKLKNQIFNHRRMNNIERLSSSPKIQRYPLSVHSYFVACMFEDFARQEGITYSTDDMYYVMRHDFMEIFSADLIYPVKNLNEATQKAWDLIEHEVKKKHEASLVSLCTDEELKEKLSDSVYTLMRVCDTLELVLFCREEVLLGNVNEYIYAIINTCKKDLLSCPFPSVREFVEGVME